MSALPRPTIDEPDLLWLQRAARLSGKGPIATAVMVLVMSRELDRRTFIMLTIRTRERHGIGAMTMYRALLDLERAGLVTVRRQRGQSPLVSIVEVEPDVESQHHSTSEEE